MNNTRALILQIMLLISAFVFFSCTKEEGNSLQEKLMETIYAGEFEFSKSKPDQRMVFSIDFVSADRVVWYDITGLQEGSWALEGDKLRMEFPSGSTVGICRNSIIEQFVQPTSQDWTIKYLYTSAMPPRNELLTKKYNVSDVGSPSTINFAENGVYFSLFNKTYPSNMFGGGIICRQPDISPGGVSYFVFPYQNAIMFNSTIGTIGSITKNDQITFAEARE